MRPFPMPNDPLGGDVDLIFSRVSDHLVTISVQYENGAQLEVDVTARNGRVEVSAYPIHGTKATVERFSHDDYEGNTGFRLQLTAQNKDTE